MEELYKMYLLSKLTKVDFLEIARKLKLVDITMVDIDYIWDAHIFAKNKVKEDMEVPEPDIAELVYTEYALRRPWLFN